MCSQHELSQEKRERQKRQPRPHQQHTAPTAAQNSKYLSEPFAMLGVLSRHRCVEERHQEAAVCHHGELALAPRTDEVQELRSAPHDRLRV